jgi:hypothetical protein
LTLCPRYGETRFCETGDLSSTAIAAVRQFPEIVRKELGKAMFDRKALAEKVGMPGVSPL